MKEPGVSDRDINDLWDRELFTLLFFFPGPYLLQMEVPRLGIELELQLLATAIAMQDLSHVCYLHQSSRQHWILNPLSVAKN